MQIGIVGLPNVGKSTLFNALTKSSSAEAANYPFCTIDPNIGIVEVPDERLKRIIEVVKPEKSIPATVEFVDIAGLVAGASKGEGLGNKFLSHIRSCNAIAQVLRFFEDSNITHVNNEIHPKNDKETIETELIIADTQTLENAIEKAQKETKSGDKIALGKLELFQNLLKFLEEGNLAVDFERDEEEDIFIMDLHLLTNKAMLYVVNVSEDELASFDKEKVKDILGLKNSDAITPICAKLESDLAEMSDEDASEFLKEYSIHSSGKDELIRAAYKTLNLETYFTAGVKEVRAWTIKKGSLAPQAAGVIHTDFEKGFICADIVFWKDLVSAGSEIKAKELGLLKMQGKQYLVQDGDVCHFKFNN